MDQSLKTDTPKEQENANNLNDEDEIYSRYRHHIGYFGRQISVDSSREVQSVKNFSRYGYYGQVITDIERTVDPYATPFKPRPDDYFRRIVLHCNKDPQHRLTLYGNFYKDDGSQPNAKKQRK
jgi:hypothetical protein